MTRPTFRTTRNRPYSVNETADRVNARSEDAESYARGIPADGIHESGDGTAYDFHDRAHASRYAGEPDSRKGHVVTKRDREAHRAPDRPIVMGEARSLPVVSSAPDTRTIARVAAAMGLESVATETVARTLDPARIPYLADRARRLARARGENLPTDATDRDLAIACVVRGDAHASVDGAAATARAFTVALKSDDALAARYASDTDQNGALPRNDRVRVRGGRPVQIPDGPLGAPRADSMAHHREGARQAACHKIADLVRTYLSRKAMRADTGRVRAEIVDLLAIWSDDIAVCDAARAAGWIVR